MTRYFTNPGYQAGTWLGHGLVGFGDGDGIHSGLRASEEQMAPLVAADHDPVTDAALSHEYAKPTLKAGTVAGLMAKLPLNMPDATEAARAAAIEAGRDKCAQTDGCCRIRLDILGAKANLGASNRKAHGSSRGEDPDEALEVLVWPACCTDTPPSPRAAALVVGL